VADRLDGLSAEGANPRPGVSYAPCGCTGDLVWPEARLIVEVDFWRAHGTQHAFQADRTLSNAVQLAGWTILRFTYADITRRPTHVVAQLRQALDLIA
jgi:very-short-patch-repair endonuclease